MTVLDQITDRITVAQRNANTARDLCITSAEANHVDHKSYKMGEAAAFNEAHKMMTAELRRLCNLFQNGALSIDSFGIIL